MVQNFETPTYDSFLLSEQLKTSPQDCHSLQYHPEAPFSCVVCSIAHLFLPETGPQVLENTERGANETTCVGGVYRRMDETPTDQRRRDKIRQCIPVQRLHPKSITPELLQYSNVTFKGVGLPPGCCVCSADKFVSVCDMA